MKVLVQESEKTSLSKTMCYIHNLIQKEFILQCYPVLHWNIAPGADAGGNFTGVYYNIG